VYAGGGVDSWASAGNARLQFSMSATDPGPGLSFSHETGATQGEVVGQFEINTTSLTDEVWSLEELVALLEGDTTEAAA
jgi:hypothetical protein